MLEIYQTVAERIDRTFTLFFSLYFTRHHITEIKGSKVHNGQRSFLL